MKVYVRFHGSASGQSTFTEPASDMTGPIVVTGSTGTVGAAVVDELLARDHD
jgi:hypothetical protein